MIHFQHNLKIQLHSISKPFCMGQFFTTPCWKAKTMQQKKSPDLLWLHHVIAYICKPEVMLTKMSSVQGMVRPPIGWVKPNSSSAILSSSWNEGWFNNDTGITNLFFSPSPTYTAKYPLGTSSDVAAALDLRRMCLALKALGKRIAIIVVLVRSCN